MNKNQSTGMYIILGILVMVFVSSILMAGPTTTTKELTYSAFLEKLANKEFKSYKKEMQRFVIRDINLDDYDVL